MANAHGGEAWSPQGGRLPRHGRWWEKGAGDCLLLQDFSYRSFFHLADFSHTS